MVKWQKRHRFDRIVQVRLKCRRICRKFTSAAASAMKGFMNIDCIERDRIAKDARAAAQRLIN